MFVCENYKKGCKEEVKGVWNGQIESLMNEDSEKISLLTESGWKVNDCAERG